MSTLYIPKLGELKFEIRKHWAKRFHYDLRLQWGRALLDWAMPNGPSCRVGQACQVLEMEDHRAKNIGFEGVHPTGTVMVWDCGSWKPCLGESAALAGLDGGYLQFALHGNRVHGQYTLTKRRAATKASPAEWSLFKMADLSTENPAYKDALERWTNSIRTGRSREQIEVCWHGGKPKIEHANLFDWEASA